MKLTDFLYLFVENFQGLIAFILMFVGIPIIIGITEFINRDDNDRLTQVNNFKCNGNCKCQKCDMNAETCVIKSNEKYCQHCLYNDYSLYNNCKNCKYSSYNDDYKAFLRQQKEFECFEKNN